MAKINLAAVNQALEEIVDSKPDEYTYRPEDVYGLMAYTHRDGSPGCLVGHVLDRFGVSRPGWTSEDNVSPWDHWRLKSLRERFTEGANARLREVQAAQDQGSTWREALN